MDPSLITNATESRNRYIRASWCALVAISGALIAHLLVIAFSNESNALRHPLIWLVLVNVPIGWYVWFALRKEWDNHRILSRYSESAYFLGYAATVAALLVFAFEIGRIGNLADNLTAIMTKGAQAVLSTVLGLLGMFLVRLRVQVLEDAQMDELEPTQSARRSDTDVLTVLTEKAPQVAAAVDALIEQLESKQLAAFANVSQLVADFGSAVSGALQSVESFHLAIGQLGQKAAQTRLEVEQLEPLLGRTRSALGGLEQGVAALTTMWNRATEGAEAAHAAGQSAAAALAPVGAMSIGLSRCSEEASSFADSIGKSHTEVANHIELLRKRTAEVGTLAEQVKQFMEIAGSVAPTLQAINKNLHDIVGVDQHIRTLTSNLTLTNSAFNGITTNLSSIDATASTMVVTTDRLVAELANQVHRLNNLTDPLAELSDAMAKLRPKLLPLSDDAVGIAKVSAQVMNLSVTLNEMESKSATAIGRVKEIAVVAADLVNTERDLHDLINSGNGRGRR